MKVKLRDIKPNPWRHIDHGYPIDPAKVLKLQQSIKRTGYWDNVVARNNKGKIELAYGHHRIEALRKEFDRNHEIDLIIRDIGDADMLKIMAAENDTMDTMSPAVINETVRAAHQFLKAHPEEMKKLVRTTPNKHGRNVMAPAVAEFLSWKMNRVEEALASIHDIEAGVIDKEDYESIPSQTSAADFRQAVKKNNLPKDTRKTIVEKLKSGEMGKQGIATEVMRHKLGVGGKHADPNRALPDINVIAGIIAKHLSEAAFCMSDGFIENWDVIDREQRSKIGFWVKSLSEKVKKIQSRHKTVELLVEKQPLKYKSQSKGGDVEYQTEDC